MGDTNKSEINILYHLLIRLDLLVFQAVIDNKVYNSLVSWERESRIKISKSENILS